MERSVLMGSIKIQMSVTMLKEDVTKVTGKWSESKKVMGKCGPHTVEQRSGVDTRTRHGACEIPHLVQWHALCYTANDTNNHEYRQ